MSAPVETPSNHLVRSPHVATFVQMGEVYVYHDLYGYILKMSPDILDFLAAFATPIDPADVCALHGDSFGEQTPESIVGVFMHFQCLVAPGADPLEEVRKFVAVRGPWNVWLRSDNGGMTFYTAWGERPVATHTLTSEEAAVWDAIDGETRVRDLSESFGAELVEGLVQRLIHHDLQAIKLSPAPLSFYKGRQHMQPPYLTSTMPYASFDPATDEAPEPLEASFSPETYYREKVADAESQFDHQETTLSHLFRHPHAALAGKTYGQAMIDGLAARGHLPEAAEGAPLKVLEIGGGLGWVARAVVETLTGRGVTVQYHILELCPTLAAAQRERTDGLTVTVHDGDATAPETWPQGPFDLVISNEMIGDLPAHQLTKAETRIDDELEPEDFKAHLKTLGEPGAWITAHDIPIGDHPDPFYLNTGAFGLVKSLRGVLRPGGVAVLTEFGEMGRYPILSTQLDHPELSIHFGQLSLVARDLGFEVDFVFVMDLIDMARDVEGFTSTRSYFRALQALLEARGVSLEKVGHTRDTFYELVGDTLAPDAFGDIRFERIEDRLLGLVPHEFKALILVQPAD